MNLAQAKSREHRAPLATEFKRQFGISPAGEFNTPEQAGIVSTCEGQRTDDPAALEMDCGTDAVDFALQTNFAGAVASRLGAAGGQRHRRLLQVIEHCVKK